MTPIEAIESMADLVEAMEDRVIAIRSECSVLRIQWDGLVRAGGGRDDHAADMLKGLRPLLSDLSSYVTRVEKQIDQWAADPFGKEAPNAEHGSS